jgi:hypothetical protein
MSCNCYCGMTICCCWNGTQPVSSSCAAIQAAQCATVGSCSTVNALIGAGTKALCAVLTNKTKVAVTSVKAQARVATAASKTAIWIIVGVIAVLAVVFYSQMKK